MRVERWLSAIAAALLVALFAQRLAAELKPGDRLGSENWEGRRAAAGRIPRRVPARRSSPRRRRVQLERIGDDPIFRAATEEPRPIRDRSRGSIIDLRTGTPPDYVYGWPFPDIDPADPQAA